ncbi:MAG: type II CAAX prenyl endopeptidase Rce1 family protein [Halanaeroarchaeum sp.]
MGYEYGFGYPGAPWTGLVVFPMFTVSAGTFLAWLTIRTESVWAPALGHGAINGVAAIGLLFVRGSPPSLLGPAPVGLLASVPWVVLAAVILLRPAMLRSAPGSPFSTGQTETGAD